MPPEFKDIPWIGKPAARRDLAESLAGLMPTSGGLSHRTCDGSSGMNANCHLDVSTPANFRSAFPSSMNPAARTDLDCRKQTMARPFAGRIAVITGGMGTGLATARKFVAEGAYAGAVGGVT
jgi:hypothetical protein